MYVPTTDQPIETLEKEVIPTLLFSSDDVLASSEERQQRHAAAERATRLGNAHHGKVDIFFKTADGQTKRVQTSVWAAHTLHITLKSGVTLPVRAILGFDFC